MFQCVSFFYFVFLDFFVYICISYIVLKIEMHLFFSLLTGASFFWVGKSFFFIIIAFEFLLPPSVSVLRGVFFYVKNAQK